MSTVQVCRVLDNYGLLIALFGKNRSHPAIDLCGPGSDTYKTITSWCKIPTNLIPHPAPGFKSTCNGILYHEETDSFIRDRFEKLYVYIDVSKLLDGQLPVNILSHIRLDMDFVPLENLKLFTAEEIVSLMDKKVIGTLFDIRSDAVVPA